MTANDFDQKFDRGDDTIADLDLTKARRPGETHRRVNVDFQSAQVAPDWAVLAAHGLPIASQRQGTASPSRSSSRSPSSLRRLLEDVVLASREEVDWGPRETEALQALMLALAHGYPSLFAAWFARSPLARVWVPSQPTGRVIKLRRIALSVLGEYL